MSFTHTNPVQSGVEEHSKQHVTDVEDTTTLRFEPEMSDSVFTIKLSHAGCEGGFGGMFGGEGGFGGKGGSWGGGGCTGGDCGKGGGLGGSGNVDICFILLYSSALYC